MAADLDFAQPALDVLVVDDNALNAKLLRLAFAGAGHMVRTASSGADALVQLAKSTPDILLLDVQMPGIDGLEVMRRLRADVRTARLPVIVISALTTTADVERAYQAGADAFMPKPVNVRVLLQLAVRLGNPEPRTEGATDTPVSY